MNIEEALKFAEECKKNGNISTSAKAVIVLAEEVNRLNKEEKYADRHDEYD